MKKKAKGNWIAEQCSETEENRRKSNNKRAHQLAKDLTTVKQGKATTVHDRSGKCLTEEWQIPNRWTEYYSELYNHKANVYCSQSGRVSEEWSRLCIRFSLCLKLVSVMFTSPPPLLNATFIHNIPAHPWPWINNCLDQWSERVLPVQLSNTSLQLAWQESGKQLRTTARTRSREANHGSAYASRYGTWKRLWIRCDSKLWFSSVQSSRLRCAFCLKRTGLEVQRKDAAHNAWKSRTRYTIRHFRTTDRLWRHLRTVSCVWKELSICFSDQTQDAVRWRSQSRSAPIATDPIRYCRTS